MLYVKSAIYCLHVDINSVTHDRLTYEVIEQNDIHNVRPFHLTDLIQLLTYGYHRELQVEIQVEM